MTRSSRTSSLLTALDELFRAARVSGPLVCLELDSDTLDDFMVHLEQTAMGPTDPNRHDAPAKL